MGESWVRFWERLIGDWVAVAVLAFVGQGVWFGATGLLTRLQPELEARLVGISASLGIFWLGIIALGLMWGFKRALDARFSPVARR